jgi:hypothetical protein
MPHFYCVLSEGIPLGRNLKNKKYAAFPFAKQALVFMAHPLNIKLHFCYIICG